MRQKQVLIILVAFLIPLAAGVGAQSPTINNFAGGVPAVGPATATAIGNPGGIGVDASGNVYFSSNTGVILKLAGGNLSVFGGNGTCCFSGDGGPATSAQTAIPLFVPIAPLKTDPAGNVYFVDEGGCSVRRIDKTTGVITTVAGIPNTDFITFSNCGFSGDNGPATAAKMAPNGLTFNPAGDLYISDDSVCVIRRVDHTTQMITTVAGNPAAGCAGTIGVGDGGAATSAQFVNPSGLAVDAAGDIFVADFFPFPSTNPGAVRRVDGISKNIATIAGGGAGMPGSGLLATQVQVAAPTGLAFDLAGNVIIADSGFSIVFSVDRVSNVITLLAGEVSPGFSGDGGAATSAQLDARNYGNMDIAVDGGGNLYITDTLNSRVREVDAAMQMINTIAGNGTANDGGPATSAIVFSTGVAVNPSGDVYISDLTGGRVRRVDHASGQISTVAGSDVGSVLPPSGDFGPATSAQLLMPRYTAVDASGTFYLVENLNLIRRVDGMTGEITPYVGFGFPGYDGDGLTANSTEINNAKGLAVNAAGDLIFADSGNQEVRKVDHVSTIVTAVAGSQALGAGFSGDGGPAVSARLNSPAYVALDAAGDVFIADRNNNVIRRVDAATGKISTVAGNFALGAGFSGDGGLATSAQLNQPRAVAVDSFGNIYIADGQFTTNRLRVVNSVTGLISTLAGTGAQNYSGDGGPATAAGVVPVELAVAPGAGGNILVYAVDALSARVRLVTIPPVPAMFLTPAAGLTFASQAVGTASSTQTVTIANSGTGTMNVANITFGGTDPGDFQIAGGTCSGTSFSLAPTASCTLLISFAPTAFGSRTASVSITDDVSGSPQAIPLSGTGLGPSVSLPAGLAFNTVPQFNTSAAMTVTLTNVGNAALNFSAPPALSGANAADFAITGGTCAVGAAVPAGGGACTVTITFTPSTSAAEAASLAFADNAVPAAQSVPLSGTGLAPGVSISGISPFGSQAVTTTSAPQTVTISVTSGTGTLQLTSLNITGANSGDFAITGASTCPTGAGQVAGGASCSIVITFTPTAVGARSATLNINGSNLPGGPEMVSLSGTGAAAPAPVASLSASSILFGVVPVGMPSAPMSVTVTNTGSAPLTFSASPAISGTNAADFAVTNNTCPTEGSVAPGGACVVTVVFTPSVATPESATLTLRNNAANSPQTVSLSGGGPGFTFTPTTTTGGDPTTLTLVAGDTGIFTVLVTCTAGVTGTVTLAVGGPLPPNTILTISPPTITCPASGPVAVKLTLQTNCVTQLVGPENPWRTPGSGPLPVAPLLAAGLMLLWFLVARTSPAGSRRVPALAALALLLVVATFTACVHNDPPALPNAPTTPAGTYALMIVGTGPTGAKSTLTLTVRVI